jgi:hypothetical protein
MLRVIPDTTRATSAAVPRTRSGRRSSSIRSSRSGRTRSHLRGCSSTTTSGPSRGTVDSDSGAQIRDGVKSVNKRGAPPETDWPYDITKFTEKPVAREGVVVLPARAGVRRRHEEPGDPLAAPHPHTESAQGLSGVGVPVRSASPSMRASRARRSRSQVTCRCPRPPSSSSEVTPCWPSATRVSPDVHRPQLVGPGLGYEGYFTMPYPYLVQPTLSSDFWTIRSVE